MDRTASERTSGGASSEKSGEVVGEESNFKRVVQTSKSIQEPQFSARHSTLGANSDDSSGDESEVNVVLGRGGSIAGSGTGDQDLHTPGGTLDGLSDLNLFDEPGADRGPRAYEGIFHTVSGRPRPMKKRVEWAANGKGSSCSICLKKFMMTGARKRTFCRKCGRSVCSSASCSSKNFWALMDHVPQRTCVTCVAAAFKDHEDLCSGNSQRRPVLIIPGFASSVLEVHKSESKKSWEGHAVWVRIEELLRKALDKANTIKHNKSSRKSRAASMGLIGSSSSQSSSSSSLLSRGDSSESFLNLSPPPSPTRRVDSSLNFDLDHVLTPESPEAASIEKQKIEAAATTLQRRFRQIATAKREAMQEAILKARKEAEAEGNVLTEETEAAIAASAVFGTPTSTPSAQSSRVKKKRFRRSGGTAGSPISSGTGATRSLGGSRHARARAPTIKRKETFTVERESTQDYLATAHPLVRHLTLGRDGVSDPPGIKVRARKGLDAVMYLSNASVMKSRTFVFGKLVEHLFDLGYTPWNGSNVAQLKNGPKSPRRKRGILSISLHKHQHHHASSDKLNPAPVITAAPYDWRISPRHLEARDGYFSDLKRKIECLYKYRGPVVLLAHSMGCMVTYYFLRWVLWHELRNMVVRAISGPEINPIHPERTVPTAAADIATPAPAPKATTELPGGSKRAPTRQLSGLVLAAHKKQLQEAETQLTILKQSRLAAEQKVQAVEEAIEKFEVRCLGFIPETTAGSGDRQGYIFQADGPKGSGFYRDTSDMLPALKKAQRKLMRARSSEEDANNAVTKLRALVMQDAVAVAVRRKHTSKAQLMKKTNRGRRALLAFHRKDIHPSYQRVHLEKALKLAATIGVELSPDTVEMVRLQEDPEALEALADVLDEGIRSPAKVVLSMFRRNINQVVRELLPKVVELHGGMSSQWARKHIEIFTSLGGPFTGTSKALRMSVDGTGMILENFFSRKESSQIVHSLSVAPSLFAVPRALNAVHSFGAIKTHQHSSIDASYDRRKDEDMLARKLVPWYEHNDVEAGSCTVERDFVMEEVYRMVSTHRLIDETEAVLNSQQSSMSSSLRSAGQEDKQDDSSAELDAQAEQEEMQHCPACGLLNRRPANGNPVATCSGVRGCHSRFNWKHGHSHALEDGIPLEVDDVEADAGAEHSNVFSEGSPSDTLLTKPGLSIQRLFRHLHHMFGPAYLNRKAKIRTLFDEYLNRAKKLPSSLPVFLVRDTSIVRVAFSNVFLHHSFTEALDPGLSEAMRRGLDWYVVVQVQYKPTVRDRNGKRPAPAQKAKSIVTRVQNMDEVMRSRILNRAREVLNKHNCEGMERPSFESLETILLQNFESKDLARHRYALRTFLEGPEDVGVGPECNSKEPPRRIRLPLAPVDFSLAPVSVALEVDSDLDDFFLSRARYVNTPQSLFEIQVATKWHNFWRAKRRRPDGTVEPFLKVSADGQSYDIASMDFVQLPADFQALTFATTSFVCPAIEKQSEDFSRKKVHARDPFDLPPRRDVSNRHASDSSSTGPGWSVYDVGKVRRGSFLDRVAEMIHVGYMRRRNFIGYNNETIPVWKDLTDQERQNDLGFVLMAVEVFLDSDMAAKRRKSATASQAAAAYRRLYKTELNIGIYAFAELDDAQCFVESDTVSNGVKLAETGASLGKFIDMPTLVKRREQVRKSRRKRYLRKQSQKQQLLSRGETTAPLFGSDVFNVDTSGEVVDLFNGWLECPHHLNIPSVPTEDPIELMGDDFKTTIVDLDLQVVACAMDVVAAVVRFQRRFRQILDLRAAARELGEPFGDALSQRRVHLHPRQDFAIYTHDEDVSIQNDNANDKSKVSAVAGGFGVSSPNADEELQGDATVKPGAAHDTTPPRTVCSVHLLVQWRRHAFKVPSADRVVPALDYGTAVSIRNDPLARVAGLLQAFARFDKDNDNSISAKEMLDVLAAEGIQMDDVRAQEIVDSLDHDGSGTIDIGEFMRWRDKEAGAPLAGAVGHERLDEVDEEDNERQALLNALVPLHILRSSFGPHTLRNVKSPQSGFSKNLKRGFDDAKPLGPSRSKSTASTSPISSQPSLASLRPSKSAASLISSTAAAVAEADARAQAEVEAKLAGQHKYIGVPASAVLEFQGGHDQVKFFDYFKQDEKLFDEASRVEGTCFTVPPACDRMLSIFGTGLPTERHAFYKRKPCISSTDGDYVALQPDREARMDGFMHRGGVAYETADTMQVRCDTGDTVRTCGDGTVPYLSLRWPSTWQRSRTWRKQRRHMLSTHLGMLYGTDAASEPAGRGCDKSTSGCLRADSQTSSHSDSTNSFESIARMESAQLSQADFEEACTVDTIEFPGLDHREMLGSKVLKRSLAALVNPTLQIHVGRLHSYWNTLTKAIGGDSGMHQHRGTRLKDMKWFWELELLPKDASVSLGISDKSGADYSPPPNYVLRTDARYVMAQPAAGSVQNDGQQGHEYEQCDSASPTNPGSPRNRRQSVWSALGSGVSGEGSNDAEAGVRRYTSLDGDNKQLSECDFAHLCAFDPSLPLSDFVGVCGKLKLKHCSHKVYATFILSSKQINQFAGSALQLQLSGGAGLLQVECNVHFSGQYSKERMRLMADDPPEPLDQDSHGFGVLDGEMTSEDALQVMHALEGNRSGAGLSGRLEGVDEDSEDTEED